MSKRVDFASAEAGEGFAQGLIPDGSRVALGESVDLWE